MAKIPGRKTVSDKTERPDGRNDASVDRVMETLETITDPKDVLGRRFMKPEIVDTNEKYMRKDGVLTTRKRAIGLKKKERLALQRRKQIEEAIAYFLDIETHLTWQQIADKMGISYQTLVAISKTPEFNDIYAQHYIQIGHDPRLVATQAAIVDLLPVALGELRKILTGDDISPTAKLGAIKEIIRVSGIESRQTASTDRNELTQFLTQAGVNIEQLNVSVPRAIMDPQEQIHNRAVKTEIIDLSEPLPSEIS